MDKMSSKPGYFSKIILICRKQIYKEFVKFLRKSTTEKWTTAL